MIKGTVNISTLRTPYELLTMFSYHEFNIDPMDVTMNILNLVSVDIYLNLL